jgi:TRAP transporter TAXI family solute receptor
VTLTPQSNPSRPARLTESWKEWLRVSVPVALLSVLAFAFAWHFVKPAPPGHVIIATGSKQGVYYAMAKKYAEYFAANGVDLEVRETGGSSDNFKLLAIPHGDVDIAIVQGGSSPPAEERAHIQAVAGIYYEPVLVFYRGDAHITQLSQLTGKKIAIGSRGSGVRTMAKMLLDEAGVSDGASGTQLLAEGDDKAADALSAGQIDAAFYVIAPDAPIVTRLMEAPGIQLMSFDHARADGRRHPFLAATTLYQGVIDIKRNLPASDVQLIAATATIAIRDSTHEAIIQLLVRAAEETNGGGTLLSDPGWFPNADRSELPVNKDALYFLKNKPSFLQRTLPFWLASLIERTIILLVPLLVVLVPLIRTMPMIYKWRMEGRILRRYKRVRHLEEGLTPASPPADITAARDELAEMEKELALLKLPVSFAEQLYNLRAHVLYVRARLDGWLAASAAQKEPV